MFYTARNLFKTQDILKWQSLKLWVSTTQEFQEFLRLTRFTKPLLLLHEPAPMLYINTSVMQLLLSHFCSLKWPLIPIPVSNSNKLIGSLNLTQVVSLFLFVLNSLVGVTSICSGAHM